MDVDDYPLLDYPSLMLTVLKVASRGEAGLDDCVAHVEGTLKRAHEHPAITREEMRRRLAAARFYLAKAGLVEAGDGDSFRITARGREVLALNPMGVDEAVLMRFPEFRAFIRETGEHPHEDPRAKEYEEGYLAYLEGRSHTDNPYEYDTIKHLAWENGWFEGREEARKEVDRR